MSGIDLIVLGCVAKQPRSAYDIQKDVEEHNLSEWTRISIPSIYKKVLRLKEQGYIAGDEVAGERFATKNVYHITDKGREYMESLMTEQSLQPPKILLDFNAVICNLNKVDKPTALVLIKNIISGIEESKQYYHSALKEHADIPLVGRTIMEQQEKVCVTLLEWAQNLYDSYKEE
jgi:DNA-binding PadR family transcriptional regulator